MRKLVGTKEDEEMSRGESGGCGGGKEGMKKEMRTVREEVISLSAR